MRLQRDCKAFGMLLPNILERNVCQDQVLVKEMQLVEK